MKLYYSPTSPYVRKVTVLAIEVGLETSIENIPLDPKVTAGGLVSDNPLAKVPTLITDDGTQLYDSPVICEYLDSLHDGPKLLPAAGSARWLVLRQQALGDGLLDAALLCMIEAMRRPEPYRWQGWVELQTEKILRAADAFEAECETLEGPLTLGSITVACALGYLDFRFPGIGWRSTRPALTEWFARFAERPSMQRSVPQDLPK